MANYAFKNNDDLPDIPKNKTFTGCNFFQATPHTPIFEGVVGLTFRDCNLINCDLPNDATVISCNHNHYDFCTNLRPSLLQHGVEACAEECKHVVTKKEIVVDGDGVDTIYLYQPTKEV